MTFDAALRRAAMKLAAAGIENAGGDARAPGDRSGAGAGVGARRGRGCDRRPRRRPLSRRLGSASLVDRTILSSIGLSDFISTHEGTKELDAGAVVHSTEHQSRQQRDSISENAHGW